MAIDKGCNEAMNNLGFYYYMIEKNYDMMKKYYLMAIDGGIGNAMNDLGSYYCMIEKNYDMAKKYYLMAIDKSNDTVKKSAMHNLAKYYWDIEQNYDMMKKYYLMSKLKSANIEDECMVCYENKRMYYTSCDRHYICYGCSVKLFEKKCPMCRQ